MKTTPLIIILFFSFLMIAGCKKDETNSQTFALHAEGNFTPKDYAVYSACLNSTFVSYPELVIRQYTVSSTASELQSRFSNALVAEFPDFPSTLFPDYITKNGARDFLGNKFTTPGKQIREVAESELNYYSATLNSAEFWGKFNEEYPNSNGYVSLSRTGYNSDSTHALVEMGHSWSTTGGQGLLIYLRFNGTDWMVLKSIVSWVP